jgi:hypothetical protein
MRGIDPVSDNGEAVVRNNPDLRFTHSEFREVTLMVRILANSAAKIRYSSPL